MDTGDLIEPGSGCRSASELATLMLELGRMVKARRFYEPGDARLTPVFERGLRAWRSDLERRGSLDLELRNDGFRERGGRGTLAHAKLTDLHRDLLSRGASRICFSQELDAEGVAGFVEAVAIGISDLQSRGGFASMVYAHAPLGVVINDRPPGQVPEDGEELSFVDEQPEAPEPAEAALPEAAAPPEPEPAPALEPDGLEAAAAEWDEALELDSGEEPMAAEPSPSETPAFDAPAFDTDEPSLERDLFETPGTELSEEEPAPEEIAPPEPRVAQAATASAPQAEAEAEADPSREIDDLLRDLELSEETSQYVELARQASRLAERAGDTGSWDECYRVVQVLSEHAVGKREERQREVARSFLSSIVQGRRLDDLILRACSAGDSESVRASQVLLALGEEVVAPLLSAAEAEEDADRRAQMHGVLIAMGEKILPELLRRMDGDDLEALKTAVRLTGETQNPDGVPRITQLLAHPDESVREEAAKALVRVGSERAIDSLIRALRSTTQGMPELAVYCLGATGQTRAVAPLIQALHDAIEERQVERGREIIRSLGRIGRPEATAALADLLRKKSLIERRWLRDLKVAAAAALGGLPGDDAVGALAQAARSKDAQLRRAAQTALDRRAQALARSNP